MTGLVNTNKYIDIRQCPLSLKIFFILFFIFCLCFIESDLKVLVQERPQPILKLHVAR